MIAEAAGVAWFGVRGAANIAIPRCGSRAGTSPGDLMFIAGFAPAHARVRQRLAAARLTVPMDEYQAEFDRFGKPPGWFPLFTGVRDSERVNPCTRGS
eukprot:4945321-Pyramimonas_sp.AAC.1